MSCSVDNKSITLSEVLGPILCVTTSRDTAGVRVVIRHHKKDLVKQY